MAIYTPAREASGGTNGARCLNLTSGLQDWEIASPRRFVLVAPESKYALCLEI